MKIPFATLAVFASLGNFLRMLGINSPHEGELTTTSVGSLFETSGARTTKFIFLGDQRIAAVTNSPAIGSTTLYYHADHLGGANVLTDATGFKKELIEYEPFGQESRHEKYGSSEEVAWFYFTGKKTDDESGLIYFGARYYDPKLGRFISPDTIVPYPKDPQSFNRYSYARNNPVNVIDPSGHKWSWKKFWNSFAGAFVGAIVTVLTGNFALGGMIGGAITGGLEGGWKGALIGGALGGALGGIAGIGIDKWGTGFGIGMLVAGAGVAAATNSWDSFAGGLAGGYVGSSLANGYLSTTEGDLTETNPTEGIRAGFSAQENENWAFLGAWTTEPKATAFANENQMSVIYTKSRGILADLFRAGFKKVGVKGPYIKQTANYLTMAEDKFILAHSEGAENLAAGIKAIAADGTKFNNLEIKWIGPAISRANATNLSNAIGARSSYSMNWADPVGAVSTFNPVLMSIYGGLGLATGTIFHGTDHYVR